MKTWDSYKASIKKTDPKNGQALADIEEQASIISAMVEQRNALGLSQRDLASICGIPQSSVARIESFRTTPNLTTLLKLFSALGLKLTVSK
jgi:ribosome-binding protein aMBF1 (putative translation factor)